jgi:hypothetical protein
MRWDMAKRGVCRKMRPVLLCKIRKPIRTESARIRLESPIAWLHGPGSAALVQYG